MELCPKVSSCHFISRKLHVDNTLKTLGRTTETQSKKGKICFYLIDFNYLVITWKLMLLETKKLLCILMTYVLQKLKQKIDNFWTDYRTLKILHSSKFNSNKICNVPIW